MVFRLDVLAIVLASCALVACRSSLGFEPDERTGDSRNAGSASLAIVGPNWIRTKGLYAWEAQVSGLSVTACELYWSATYPPSTLPVDLGAGAEQKFMVRAGDGDFQLKVTASCLPSESARLLVFNRIGVDPS
jgi:hypothetical protein